MSEGAVKWAGDQIAPCGRSKMLLMRLAAFADAEGVTWASVPWLAEDLQCSDRTVQRLLGKLLVAELLAPTGDFKYRNIPFYQLALHVAGALAKTRAERAALAAKRRFLRAKGRANGDIAVTVEPQTNGDTGVTVENPNGDICDANGDTGVTQRRIDEEEKSANALGAREQVCVDAWEGDFEALYEAWKRADPNAVEKPRDRKAFREVVESAGGGGRLRRAGERYLGQPRGANGRVFSLARWLSGEKWEPFVGDGWVDPRTPQSAAPAWPPTGWTWGSWRDAGGDVVATIGEAKDPGWIGSWLGRAGWDAEARAFVVTTGIGVDRVRRELADVLRQFGLGVRLWKPPAPGAIPGVEPIQSARASRGSSA